MSRETGWHVRPRAGTGVPYLTPPAATSLTYSDVPAWEPLMKGMIVRCPYCALGSEFRLMVAHLDGRFICAQCGHLAFPTNPDFGCSCPNCEALKSKRLRKGLSP